MASTGDGTPGRWIFLGALGWLLGLALLSHMFGHPVTSVILLFAATATAIVWVVDSIFLDSELGDRMHRAVMGRARANSPAPWRPMQSDFKSLDGAPDWARLRERDGH